MNKLFTKIATLCVGLAMAVGVGVAAGSNREAIPVHAAEEVYYTLTSTDHAGSNNSYSGNCDIEIDNLTWNVEGNAQMIPWRVGSKNTGTSSITRSVTGKSAINVAITKINLTVTKSGTVGGGSLIVASDSDFSSVIDTVSLSVPSNSVDIVPTTLSAWPKNSYYKFQFTGIVANGKSAVSYAGFDTADFYYDAPDPSKSLSSIALSGTYPTTFEEGDAFSHTGMVVTATYSDASTEDVTSSASFSGYNMSSTGNQTVTVSYTFGGVTKTETYSITVNPYVGHTWTKVTSALSDWRGTYLLVFESGNDAYILNSALTTLDATYNTVSGTISNSKITGTKAIDSAAIKIERNTIESISYYHVKCANGNYMTSSYKGIGSQNTATTSNAATINEDYVLQIGSYILRFNTANNQLRFRFGDTSYVSATCVYKMDSTTAINTEVSSYATSFLTNVTCSGAGSIVNDGWSGMATTFNGLTVDAQGILANTVGDKSGSGIAGAIGRYDEIIEKHGDDHSDFMNRFIEGAIMSSANKMIPFIGNTTDSNVTTIIVIVSLVGLTAIGGYFFLRRKKHI